IDLTNCILAKFMALPAVIGPRLVEKGGNGRLRQARGSRSIDGYVAHALEMAAILSMGIMKKRYVHSSSCGRKRHGRP
ncbi:MAG TPA: hypothetical protein VJR88_14595, partial [Novosphingobium sp.]|nr:hypothetical protein [Novosphingobium sp.]